MKAKQQILVTVILEVSGEELSFRRSGEIARDAMNQILENSDVLNNSEYLRHYYEEFDVDAIKSIKVVDYDPQALLK